VTGALVNDMAAVGKSAVELVCGVYNGMVEPRLGAETARLTGCWYHANMHAHPRHTAGDDKC